MYLCEEAEAMVMSNLWSEVRFQNTVKVEVVDFYTTTYGPRTSQLLKAGNIILFKLSDELYPFITDIPCFVAISKKYVNGQISMV